MGYIREAPPLFDSPQKGKLISMEGRSPSKTPPGHYSRVRKGGERWILKGLRPSKTPLHKQFLKSNASPLSQFYLSPEQYLGRYPQHSGYDGSSEPMASFSDILSSRRLIYSLNFLAWL